ncbi:SusD family protein [Pedobacter steynii]|uniref:SusD family protein n=1 Tax=Pedobacter steynii TaxID=430522 RepID=A0A1G9PB70_9SPHI|nr:RagB/SusD family nutrient uptake outer membrane protein [Pedobacter steynii]NQX39036.1 RagB/SusD family nutrient uptake outer membrane protein [Pedobacter steynii]SDL95989.1 SusD family protein [Pedobacter steynii]
MKKLIIISFAVFSMLTSCKKTWLEIVPQGDQVTVITEDYDKLMNDGAFYAYHSIGGYTEAQLMGDEVAQVKPYFINKNAVRERLFQWADDIYPEPAVTSLVLRTTMTQMYTINKIVAEVMTSTGGTEERKKGIRAEALATRAFSIWNMASLYCKPYAAATAGNDPGFPFVTEPNVNIQDIPRGTLQQTYDFIIKDYTEALASIPAKQNIVTRMSRPAVEGLLGKVYLFMGRYNDALPLLKSALAHVIANGQTSLYDYNETFATGGAFLPISATNGPKSPYQLMDNTREAVVSKVFYAGRFNGNITGTDGLVLTKAAQALYQPTDYRLKFYINKNDNNSVNAAGLLRKYGLNYSRFGLQLSELYLLCAEAKARANDLTGAVADLETLRKARIRLKNDNGDSINDALVPAGTATNQSALIKFIIDERIREFAVEGYRWFDMRRLSVDPLFAGATFTHTVYDQDAVPTVLETYTLKQPERLVMRFPRNIIDANPKMQDNP